MRERVTSPKKIAGNPCIMNSETTGQTITVKMEEAAATAATGSVAVKEDWRVSQQMFFLDELATGHCGLDMMLNVSCVSCSAHWVIVTSTAMMCERFGKNAKRKASGTEVFSSRPSIDTHILLISLL